MIENPLGLIFEFPFRFFPHTVVPDFITLRFDLVDPNRQIADLFFTSNMFMKRRSDFLALCFLTGVGVMGYMGLLSVNILVL